MTDIEEKLILPEPLKVKPSIARYLDDLEEQGKTIFAFTGADIVETLAYLYLLNKYKSKCFAKSNETIIHNKRSRPLGLNVPLKLKYSKEEENEIKVQFTEISIILTNCVKRGENTIIIPLGYKRGSSGHANMLILRMNKRELEHYEPHGGEFSGNERLQLSAKRLMAFFVNNLNRELKKNNLPEVKYIDASEVCPYISGLQDLEGKSKLPKKGKLEPSGYCVAWSIFFAELCLKNPDMSSSELLDNVYNYLTTKASGPDYLKGVIRGYAGFITQKIDMYLSVFFKKKITIASLINNMMTTTYLTVHDVLDLLVELETYIAMTPDFNLKKELKKAMKEYRDLTKGKTKEEQIKMRRGWHSIKEVELAYYKKRILQNFEEYKRLGTVTSEPIFDSPKEITRGDIKNLDVLKKGLLHEEVEEQKRKYKEELEKQPWYIEQQKQKKEWQEQKKKAKKTIGKKTSPQAKTKKILPKKKEINMMQEIIERENIDIKTKEGQQKLLKILQDMAKK